MHLLLLQIYIAPLMQQLLQQRKELKQTSDVEQGIQQQPEALQPMPLQPMPATAEAA